MTAGAAEAPVGVVVMAYGTPSGPEAIPAYYTHIRRGRPPTEEQLADLIRRYDALGGVSRLAERTRAQRARLALELEARAPGRFRVVIGQRHAEPFIADAVSQLVQPPDGGSPPARIIGLVLAPHYSAFSVGGYASALAHAAGEHGIPVQTIEHWYDLAEYTSFLAAAVREALAACRSNGSGQPHVCFTAHSLPERLLIDDPYPDQLRDGARRVAAAAALSEDDWSIAWQSAGATDDVWRGPDINEVIRASAASNGRDGIVVCPHGFVTDHLEVAYDLDIESASIARESGIDFARTRVLDDDPSVFAALAHLVIDTGETH